ncbi:MAG TPA: hypothetical protein P5561_03880 [Candidatus Omnitrophota bacterium]|nr:hypothetical protein [Candidatus Omnitrophota bacterium]
MATLSAAYYTAEGYVSVDAQLLYEAVTMLLKEPVRPIDPIKPSIPKPYSYVPESETIKDPIRFRINLFMLAQITVTKVDDQGAIHFTRNEADYVCYRNAAGNPVLLPATVHAYVQQLQSSLGSLYTVSVSVLYPRCTGLARCVGVPPQYRISINFSDRVNTIPEQGALVSMSFIVDSQADYTGGLAGVEYMGFEGKVDAELLYAGLSQLSDKPIDLFRRIRISQADETGIYFSLLRKPPASYHIYRSATGEVVLKPITKTPAQQLTAAGLDLRDVETVVMTDAQLAEFLAAMQDPDAQFSIQEWVSQEQVTSLIGDKPPALRPVLAPFDLSKGQVRYMVSIGSVTYMLTLDPNHPDGARWVYTKVEEITKEDALAAAEAMEDSEQKAVMLDLIENAPEGTKFYKVTDGAESVTYQWTYPRIEELVEYAENLTDPAQKAQFLAALQDVGPNSTYSIQTSEDGSKSWVWTSADGQTTYTLSMDVIRFEDPGTIVTPNTLMVTTRWNFSASTPVLLDEVEQYAAQLPADQRAMFESAIAGLSADTIFTKVISGEEVNYTWGDQQNLTITYHVSVHMVPVLNPDGTITQQPDVVFSIQQQISPVGLEQYAQNLPNEAQQIQFARALEDVGPNSTYSIQTSEDGSKSWVWTSADGLTTYILANEMVKIMQADGTIQTLAKWSFSARTEVSQEEVLAEAARLPADQRAAFESALANTTPLTVFTRIISGDEKTYSWEGMHESRPATFVVATRPEGLVNFSIQQQISPVGLDQYAQNLTDPVQRDQFLAALQDVGSDYTIQLGNDGSQAWAWTSAADPDVTYVLKKSIIAMQQADGSIQTTEEWAFSIQTEVEATEVSAQLDFIEDAAMHAAAQAVINQGTSFNKVVTGEGDPVYHWRNADNSSITYSIAINSHVPVGVDPITFTTEAVFATMENVPIEEAEAYAANLSAEIAQKALDAIAQAKAAGVTMVTKTIAVRVSGEDVSYSWSDPEIAAKTYTVSIGHNGEVYFSIQIRVDESSVIYALGLEQYAENLTDPAQKAQFLAALEDGILISMNTYTDGGQSWTLKSKTDPKITYVLKKSIIAIQQADGTIQHTEEWSFITQTEIEAAEVSAQLGFIEDPVMRAAAEAAIGQGTGFHKVVTGAGDPVYRWRNAANPGMTYSIAVNSRVPVGVDPMTFATEAVFSTMENVPIEEAEAYAANLSAEIAQKALDAIAQAKAAGVTMVTKTIAVRVSGEDVSYSWSDPEIAAKTYTVSIGHNGEVYFSIQVRVDQQTTQYTYDPVTLPQLWVPLEGLVFPAVLKHYRADGTLLRTIELDAEGKPIIVNTYVPGSEIPAKVEVYQKDTNQLHAVLAYNDQGQLESLTIYNSASSDPGASEAIQYEIDFGGAAPVEEPPIVESQAKNPSLQSITEMAKERFQKFLQNLQIAYDQLVQRWEENKKKKK